MQALLAELAQFGEENDRSAIARADRMLNITPDTGAFLSILVRSTQARRILEIGTSNGYSTLWLAEAALATGGHVWTVEHSDAKADLAARNFLRAGLGPHITQVRQDAGVMLAGMGEASFDLIFLDSERTEYPGWWPDLNRALRPGGLLVVDNATSHSEELVPFITAVQADPAYTTCLVPVGKGEFLATRSRLPD
ncbi:MAG: O-methyltransferase [Geothrix sp.]|nr:O-methyltransferase [Geothrix sp.]WIL20898.1 MAG: O-methyltransferase [Geothrix sp.]